MAELKQSVVDKAVEQWWPRLRTRVHAKGQHFEKIYQLLSVSAGCSRRYDKEHFNVFFQFTV